MRRLGIGLVVLVLALGGGGPALAKGPSGSEESKDNKVKCNRTTGQAGTGVNVYNAGNGVYLGAGGAEVCSDDDSAIDGRIIVSCEGYVGIDGDSSNPNEGKGWARVSSAGPQTGNENDPKTGKDNDVSDGKKGSC